jgi:hypothetical protein
MGEGEFLFLGGAVRFKKQERKNGKYERIV